MSLPTTGGYYGGGSTGSAGYSSGGGSDDDSSGGLVITSDDSDSGSGGGVDGVRDDLVEDTLDSDGSSGSDPSLDGSRTGGPAGDESDDSNGGNVSDTAIGASYRDTQLEDAAERTQGEDAADTVAAGGVASAINFGDTSAESVAEDAEATGTTESLTDAFDRAFPDDVATVTDMNPSEEVQNAVERIREPIPIPFDLGGDEGVGSGVIVAVGAALVGLVAISLSGGDG
jgi:hypothetical protein